MREIDGDIIEWGVSIGHGALLFRLVSDFVEKKRVDYGFDSCEEFPVPVAKDENEAAY